MRIAQVTATFPPYHGGTGNVCFQCARELAKRGHEIHVFTASLTDKSQDEKFDNIKVHRLKSILRVGNAFLVTGLVKKLKKFDIIHLHYPFYGGELTAFAAKHYGTPLIITYHQDVILHGVKLLVERILRNSIERWVLQSADYIFFTSRDYSRASEARHSLTGIEHKVGVLPNGVDIAFFTPGNPAASLYDRYKQSPDDLIVLMVAKLDQAHFFKGVHIFLEALSKLTVSVKGIIIGDGDLRAEYESIATKLGINRRIYFVGHVTNEELVEYYRLADVCVLPSTTMGEAFGLVLIESMSCETPVIASNLPGVRTVIQDGEDGLLVEPGNPELLARSLIKILVDEGFRHMLGKQGRAKVVDKFDWEKIVDRLENSYMSIQKSRRDKNEINFH